MTLAAAVAAYEAWMRGQVAVVESDLAAKHAAMAASPFAFLRATCFRFAARLPGLCPELLQATPAPAVGDAHLENFGTWRDAEGRLIWGVNDLDEAVMLPWPLDLVRLAASALLVPAPDGAHEIAGALLAGYAERLARPRPFVLDRENDRLRDLAAPDSDERRKFWRKLEALPEAAPPAPYAEALRAALPEAAGPPRFAARRAGLGSLGRPRFVALAEWRGGPVAREAKARLPSAWLQARCPGAAPIDLATLATHPRRAPDPWFRATPTLTTRRLAPDSRKLEAPPGRLLDLLAAMGGEVANLHAGGPGGRIAGELAAQAKSWLRDAARRLADDVADDHRRWAA